MLLVAIATGERADSQIVVPAVPVLQSPANNSTNQPIQIALSWGAAAHASTYRLQTATVATFPDTSIVLDTIVMDNGSMTMTVTTDPLKNTTKYYWRVNANSPDSTSAWSTVWNLTTIIPAPGIVALTVPVNFALSITVSPSPTLRWNLVSGATQYHVQVDTSSSFTTPLTNDSTLVTNSRTVSQLFYYKRHYWRVRAKNIGGAGPWSSAQTFLTELAAPVLAAPATAAGNQPISLTLKWNKNTSANKYTLQLSTSSAFASLLLADSSLTDTVRAVGPLANATIHYWRVRAVNDSCISPYQTTASSFTTIVAAPVTPPVPVAPLDGAVNQVVGPIIRWNSVTGATKYHLQVATDTGFVSTVYNDTNIATTSVALSSLCNYAKYYWRVRGWNVGGSSTYCTTQSFVTELAQPVQTAPVTNAPNQTLPVTLGWSSVPFAIHYHVQVSTASTFSPATTIVFQDSTITDTTQIVNMLLNSATYYWRVKAKNDICVSSFPASAPKFSTIVAVPPTPALSAPANNAALVATNPTMQWGTAGATTYRLQIASDTMFASLFLNDSTITTTQKAITGLANNTQYFWRVNAKNIGGTSSFTPFWNFTTTLAAPTLLLPANKSAAEPVDEIFSWMAVAGASGYHLIVATDSLFKTIIYDQPSLTAATDTVHVLLNTLKYYWKILPKNGAGEGTASTVWSFTTVTAPPPAPALLQPTDGLSNQAASTTIKWNSVYSAMAYDVQVSTDSLFGITVADDSSLFVSQKQVNGLAYNTQYFWCVRGKNSSGWGAYSIVWSFYTTLQTPTPQLPANNAINQSITPTLQWDLIDGASTYQVQVAVSSSFSSLLVVDSSLTSPLRAIGPLSNNTKYYWRVNAKNVKGATAFSSPAVFTTVVSATAAPKLAAPLNSAVNQSMNTQLRWNASTGALTYQVQIAADSFFVAPYYDTTISTLNITLPMPLNGMTYYWRVYAKNPGGSSPSSEIWKYSTVLAAPFIPALACPLSSTIGVTASPVLKWFAAWSAKKYHLQVSTDSPFNTLVYNDSTIADTVVQLGLLAYGARHYWRVRALNDSGASVYSQIWNFKTRLQSPVLTDPYYGSQNTPATLQFRWNPVPGTVTYRLQVATDSLFTHLVNNDSTIVNSYFTVAGMASLTTYYWRVGAKDADGYTSYSNRWMFSTKPAEIAPPVLQTPASAVFAVPLTSTFSWLGIPPSIRYTLQIAKDTPFDSLVVNDSGLTGTSYSRTLQEKTIYYWRVTGRDSNNVHATSVVWSFTTLTIPPAAPMLSLPTIGSIMPTALTLQWNATIAADRYRIQVATDSLFTSMVKDDSLVLATSYTIINLNNGVTYYWRVLAYNAGGYSPASATWRFRTISVVAPTPPVALSPAVGTVVPTIAMLQWSPVSAADKYRVQIALDSLFSGTLVTDDSLVLPTTYRTINLKNGTTYFWRIFSINFAGTSGPSIVWSFKTINTTPLAPLQTLPVNATNGLPNRPVFQWKPAAGASRYRLQIAEDTPFRVLVLDDSTLVDTLYQGVALNYNSTYYWRIQAINNVGLSAFSDVWSFNTAVSTPDVPVLATPASGSRAQVPNLRLTWWKAARAQYYHVQFSEDSPFSSIVFEDSLVSDTTCIVNALQKDKLYFWRISARNAGGTSQYSSVWSFSTVQGIPATPAQRAPLNSTVDVSLVPVFQWSAAYAAATYHLQVAEDAAFQKMVYQDSLLTDTSFSIPPLQSKKRYYWRIRAANSSGIGTFSPSWSFETIEGPLVAPMPQFPTNSVIVSPVDLPIQWNSVPWATKYHLQIAEDAAFAALVKNDSTITDTLCLAPVLQFSKKYYWRVCALNAHGAGPYSATLIFTTSDGTPNRPSLRSPTTLSIDLAVDPIMQWSGVVWATTYQLEVATDAAFHTIAFNDSTITDTVFHLPTLQNDVSYYWRVRALNGTVSSLYSTVWTFTTIKGIPQIVVLRTPLNNTTGTPIDPILQWSRTQSVSWYRLQVAQDVTFSSIVYEDTTLTDTLSHTPPLQYNKKYYWRVRAENTRANGPYSLIWSFTTTEGTPPVPVLRSPATLSGGVAIDPLLFWASSTYATRYHVQIAEEILFHIIAYEDSIIIDSTVHIPPLQNDKRYYWRVRALNNSATSAFSTVWSFTTIEGVATTPLLRSPATAATSQPVDPVLVWSTVQWATRYHVLVGLDAAFTSIVFEDSTLIDTTVHVTGLQNGKSHYWKVRAINARGASTFSSAWTFTTVEGMPLTPSLRAPVASTASVPIDPVLQWKSSQWATRYHLQVAEDTPFKILVLEDTAATDTIYRLPALQNDKRYYWRVRALNRIGTSPFSEIWNFMTIVAPPAVPVLQSPSNGGYSVSLNALITWCRSMRADSYHLQVSDDALFRTLVFEDSTLTDTTSVVGPLRMYTMYYWRMRAKNAGGTTNFSTTWKFSTSPNMGVHLLSGEIPSVFSLSQNYPNPFNPSTTIQFGLPDESQVSVNVYDLLGREVSRVISDRLPAGYFAVPWNASSLASGAYFYRIVAQSMHNDGVGHTFVQTKKLLLTK